MKNLIFIALKQNYSHLHLGDDILSIIAEKISQNPAVNRDNIEMWVKNERDFLEKLQFYPTSERANICSSVSATT